MSRRKNRKKQLKKQEVVVDTGAMSGGRGGRKQWLEEQAPEERNRDISGRYYLKIRLHPAAVRKKKQKHIRLPFKTPSGDVFCTQTVEDGKTASKPKLQPSASGSWNYDFTKAVTENIIIKWSAQ